MTAAQVPRTAPPREIGLGEVPADAPLPGRESYSSLSTYESCPRRYAYRYVERLPGEVPPSRFAYGRAIHEALEAFVRARIASRTDGSPEPGIEVLVAACDASLEAAGLEPDELEQLRSNARPTLGRCYARELVRPDVPVAVELGFGIDVPFPDGEAIRFVGYLDRVDRAPDGSLTILDYKTGRQRRQESVDADRQLTAYAWAAAAGALRDPATGDTLPAASRLVLSFPDEDVEVSTHRTSAQLAAFEADVLAMAGAVRSRQFAPRPDRWTCRWCEYRSSCPSALDT